MGVAPGAAELSSRTAALSPHPSPELTGPEVFIRSPVNYSLGPESPFRHTLCQAYPLESEEVFGCWQHQFLSIIFSITDDAFPHWSQTEVGLSPAHEDKCWCFCWVHGGLCVINTAYSGWHPAAWELRGCATFKGVWDGHLIRRKNTRRL